MSNMSYCRFRNTYSDLQDCYEHLGDDDLSQEELVAKKRLIKLCKQITEDESDIEE